MTNGEAPKKSLGRRIFLYATWAALVYSVYATADIPYWLAWPSRGGDTRGVPTATPTAKPSEVELAGLWVPDEETAARLKGLNTRLSGGSASPQLSLTKTSFEARDIPYLSEEGGPRVVFASWRGGWNLYRQGDTWAVYLPGGPADVRGFLYGERPPYRLRLTVSDSPMNEPLWFVRK